MVIDDHQVVRAGICAVLGREADVEIVGSFGSAEEAVGPVRNRRVDVVVCDYRLPGADGAWACAQIRRKAPGARVVMLSGFATPESIRACLAAGAAAYLAKEDDPTHLLTVVREVAAGLGVFSGPATGLIGKWAAEAASAGLPGAPNPTERMLLALLAQGLSNRQIGERLRVSEHTVKVRLRTLMRKLGVARRSEAVAVALRQGVI